MKIKLYKSGVIYDEDYFLFWWNILPKQLRYFGFSKDYYDGPIGSFGYWYGNFTWRTPWTKE